MGPAGRANADAREIPLDGLGLDPVRRISGKRWDAVKPGSGYEATEEDETRRTVGRARRRVFGSEGVPASGDPGGFGFSQCLATARAEEVERVLCLSTDKVSQPGLQDGSRTRLAAGTEEKEGQEAGTEEKEGWEPGTVSPSAHGPDLRS